MLPARCLRCLYVLIGYYLSRISIERSTLKRLFDSVIPACAFYCLCPCLPPLLPLPLPLPARLCPVPRFDAFSASNAFIVGALFLPALDSIAGAV